jgi:hypothetical protein
VKTAVTEFCALTTPSSLSRGTLRLSTSTGIVEVISSPRLYVNKFKTTEPGPPASMSTNSKLPNPGHPPVNPSTLWTDVVNAYGLRKGQLPYFRMPAPSKPGTDFGRPRFGVNTFDFAWLLLHPQKTCVTTLAPDGKGGSKPESTCN